MSSSRSLPFVASCYRLLFLHHNPVSLCCSEPCLRLFLHAVSSSVLIRTLSPYVAPNPVSLCCFMLSSPLSSSEPCRPLLFRTLSPSADSCCLLLFLHQNPVSVCCFSVPLSSSVRLNRFFFCCLLPCLPLSLRW